MNENTRIGVGIIGVNPDRGWARRAHIPALSGLPDFRIVALSTSRPESAAAAARAFNVERTFSSHEDLIREPAVDLVVVTVKVPAHFELVASALAAGKHVFCEWPLAVDAVQAERLLALAQKQGRRHFIGFQGRMSPAINYVKSLVADGYVGRVLSSSVIGTAPTWGPSTDQFSLYLRDPVNGATMLSIPVGHFLDAFCYCLGDFVELSAKLATQRTEVILAETGATVPAGAPDQVAIHGELEGGTLASIHYRGGSARGPAFHWEINGTDGDLEVSVQAGHAHMDGLEIRGGKGPAKSLRVMEIPEKFRWAPTVPDGEPLNVGQLYARLAKDLRTGSKLCADFATAVARHHLLETIMASSETGTTQRL